MGKINVNIHASGEKTAELICNWCKEPHAVEPEYKKEILERGARELKECAKELEERNIVLTPEETWTCGKCMLVLNGIPEFVRDALKTECHDHEVPETRP
jgi:hypothetical protein